MDVTVSVSALVAGLFGSSGFMAGKNKTSCNEE